MNAQIKFLPRELAETHGSHLSRTERYFVRSQNWRETRVAENDATIEQNALTSFKSRTTLVPAYEMRPRGKVLVAGGDSGSFSSGLLANAELYDPDTGTFSPAGNMSTLRHQHTATLLTNGKVLVAGGVFSRCQHCLRECRAIRSEHRSLLRHRQPDSVRPNDMR